MTECFLYGCSNQCPDALTSLQLVPFQLSAAGDKLTDDCFLDFVWNTNYPRQITLESLLKCMVTMCKVVLHTGIRLTQWLILLGFVGLIDPDILCRHLTRTIDYSVTPVRPWFITGTVHCLHLFFLFLRWLHRALAQYIKGVVNKGRHFSAHCGDCRLLIDLLWYCHWCIAQ